MFVDFNILNQLGSPSINSNTFANRPAAGQTGRLFVSTDTFEIFRDNGTGWDLIGSGSAGISGSGTATQVAYFTGATAIGSSSNLYWDNTNTRLGIGTSSPGVRLDVHGTGNMLQLNATAATANTLMSFQRLGSNVWRLGDQYSGGFNYFELHNAVLNNNAAEFQAATNKATFSALETYSSGGATGSLFSYTITVPGGTNFTGPNVIGNVNSALVLNLGGNTTVPNSARQGLEGNSRINFTGAGTLTMTQGTGTVRAFSALSSVYSFNGTAVGTVTHLAGLRICFPDNIGSAINITNNYGLLLNNQTAGTGTVTYTNRWGIYQEGSSDLNYFNGNLLIKSTTNSGEALQVTGTAKVTSTLTVSGSITGTSNSNTFGTSSSGGFPIILNTGTGANSLKINGRNSAPNDESAIEFFRFDGVTRVAFIQAATSFLAFCTSTEAMRLNSSNFLGIGTQTIGSRLQVNGGAAIGYSASTAAPTNGLAVAGNVGVGTITPGTVAGYQTLQIQGTTTGALLEMWANAARILQINANTSDVNIYGATNVPMIFFTNTVERFRINAAGGIAFADANNIAFNTTTGTKIGTATSQKLSFWNATPIVQPTTAVAGAARVGGGGTTVTDTDTFGGYTIAQVVQALRNTGILA